MVVTRSQGMSLGSIPAPGNSVFYTFLEPLCVFLPLTSLCGFFPTMHNQPYWEMKSYIWKGRIKVKGCTLHIRRTKHYFKSKLLQRNSSKCSSIDVSVWVPPFTFSGTQKIITCMVRAMLLYGESVLRWLTVRSLRSLFHGCKELQFCN